jgi:hypothetical protein
MSRVKRLAMNGVVAEHLVEVVLRDGVDGQRLGGDDARGGRRAGEQRHLAEAVLRLQAADDGRDVLIGEGYDLGLTRHHDGERARQVTLHEQCLARGVRLDPNTVGELRQKGCGQRAEDRDVSQVSDRSGDVIPEVADLHGGFVALGDRLHVEDDRQSLARAAELALVDGRQRRLALRGIDVSQELGRRERADVGGAAEVDAGQVEHHVVAGLK